MNRTFTPELDPGTLNRLDDYAGRFRDLFNGPRQAAWCGVYLRGLIQDGGRKSVDPITGTRAVVLALVGKGTRWRSGGSSS